jgi:putative endonuclease
MWFHRNGSSSRPAPAPARSGGDPSVTTKQRGDAAEDSALEHLQRHGMRLLQRNFKTPGRGGGEVDLIMRDTDGTLVFVEVRQRASGCQGGAGASITAVKQRRVVLAARHFLAQLGSEPPCRFDVVLMEGRQPPLRIEWHRAAFDAPATF